MKTIVICFLGLIVLNSCSDSQANNSEDNIFATLPQPQKGEEVATFAGGCFWSMSEALSELNGVNTVIAGYSGGTVKNPTYEDVSTKLTGHAESVKVYYNPAVISYATLAEAFFAAHDPTTPDRQGPDEGPNYRSIAFYHSAEEKLILEQQVTQINKSHRYRDPVVTQLLPFKIFYPAEIYHQGYYRSHMESPYIAEVSQPKVLEFRRVMNKQLKAEFQEKIK